MMSKTKKTKVPLKSSKAEKPVATKSNNSSKAKMAPIKTPASAVKGNKKSVTETPKAESVVAKKVPATPVAEKKSSSPKSSVARTLNIQEHSGEIGTRQLNLNHPYSISAKMSLKESKKDDDVLLKNYKISTKFTVGDRLVHQEFGKGLVRDVIGEHKIKVSFKDFEKILVHGVN